VSMPSWEEDLFVSARAAAKRSADMAAAAADGDTARLSDLADEDSSLRDLGIRRSQDDGEESRGAVVKADAPRDMRRSQAALLDELGDSEDEEEALRALWEDVRGTSRVGRRISSLIKMQVIVGVICIVFSLPLLSSTNPEAARAVPRALDLIDAAQPASMQKAAAFISATAIDALGATIPSNASLATASAIAARGMLISHLIADMPDVLYLRIVDGTGGIGRRMGSTEAATAKSGMAGSSSANTSIAGLRTVTDTGVAAGTALAGLEGDP